MGVANEGMTLGNDGGDDGGGCIMRGESGEVGGVITYRLGSCEGSE